MARQRIIKTHFFTKSDFDLFFEKFNFKPKNKSLISVTITNDCKLTNITYKKEVFNKNIISSQKEWKQHWTNLYDFDCTLKHEFHYAIVFIKFKESFPEKKISEIFEQSITKKTVYINYPYKDISLDRLKRCVTIDINPKYPIYIISKGRADCCYTADHLIKMGVPFKIVIEKQEWEDYKKYYDESYLLELDMRFKDEYDTYIKDFDETKSKGSGPARNFVWNHAKESGAEWHWIMDDNIDGFYVFKENYRVKACDGGIFAAAENFIDRYENIGISGLNYRMFVIPGSKDVPYVANTKIYSCILIKNSLPMQWAGRYNEDVDLCIRALKEGYSTIQFDAFMANKISTQSMGGGNTEAFYAEEGTLPKSKQLKCNHPDITDIKWRFSRWHHIVNYDIFKYYRLRTIYQTIQDISKKQILSEDSEILDKIRNIDFYSDIDYNQLFTNESNVLRKKVIDIIKKYRYKRDVNFIIEKLIEKPLLDLNGMIFFDTLSEDEKIAKCLLNLPYKVITKSSEIAEITKLLDFVKEEKKNAIINELVRNKYILKDDYEVVDFNFRFLYITLEEHKEKKDSKAYIYKKYLNKDIGKEPTTLLCKIARGLVPPKKKKDFTSQLKKRGESKVDQNKKLICIIGDKYFKDRELFEKYINSLKINNNKIAFIHSVNYNIDLYIADYALKNKYKTFEFVPDFNNDGIFAISEVVKKMAEKCDYALMFLKKDNIEKCYQDFIDYMKTNNKKIKIVYYDDKNINLNDIF